MYTIEITARGSIVRNVTTHTEAQTMRVLRKSAFRWANTGNTYRVCAVRGGREHEVARGYLSTLRTAQAAEWLCAHPASAAYATAA